MTNGKLIGIAGNIGVGKTTLTERLSEKLGWNPYYESVIDNPYLSDFYGDMRRWSFNLQIYFLSHRFRSQKEIVDSGKNAIQDRTIYEDVEIFAKSLFEQGFMSDRDYQSYCDLFANMVSFLPQPTVIIYLKAPADKLIERIRQRGRDYEKTIDPDYIRYLNNAYESWISRARNNFDILTVDAAQKDYLNKEDDLDELLERIKNFTG